MARNAASVLLFAACLAGMYVLVMWVTASYVATHHGPIKWSEGWAMTEAALCEALPDFNSK